MKTLAPQQKSLAPVANHKPKSVFDSNRSSLLSPNARTLADSRRPLIQTKLTVNEPDDKYEQEADRVAEEVTRSGAAPSQVSLPRWGRDFSKIRVSAPPMQVQTKLTVNEPGDKDEQEADRIAEEVMRVPDFWAGGISVGGPPNVQKKCAACESGAGLCPECAEEEKKLQRKPLTWTPPSLVQREQAMPDDMGALLQTKNLPGQGSQPTTDLNTRVQALTSTGGKPLPESERAFFEPRLGFDFSKVKIFHDSEAADLNRGLNARAFTLGNNIAFGAGQFAPETDDGRRLMAHELTHVVQQESGAMAEHTPLSISLPNDPFKVEMETAKAEMETAAETVMSGKRIFSSPGVENLVQRTPAGEGVGPAATTLPATIKFWINAFIPNTIKGVKPVPAGPLKGQAMFKGPFLWSDCFLSDNRGFDNNIAASSRMHIEAEVATASMTLSFPPARSHPTREVDCEDGDIECDRTASPRALVTLVPNWPPYQSDPNLFQLPITGAANDPCFTESPDVDVDGMARIDPRSRTFRFEGSTDPFPAFEMYVSVENGTPKTVFTYMPPSGTTAWSLVGKPNLAQSGIVSL